MADEVKQPQPTASEALFFYSIVKNMKALTDIDWNAVAEDRGFKNAEVAKVRFGQVKRKLGIQTEGSKPGTKRAVNPLTTPVKGTPSKVTKATPSRSGTKGKRGGGRVKKEEERSDEDDEQQRTPTKTEPKDEHDVKEEKSIQESIDSMMAGGDPF